jgi:hypothetical protein
VDAGLPHCPILVFPSWEKTLERHDDQTISGERQLIVDILAHYVDSGIHSLDEGMEFAKGHPAAFVSAVEKNRLFVAPGGKIGETVVESLNRYKAEIKTWRTEEWMSTFGRLTNEGQILNAIAERIAPQFHLLENSGELGAHPLVSIEQQAHYFRLVSHANSGRLLRSGLLDHKTRAIIDGLSSERLAWLSGLSIDALVELRSNNENVAFRKSMTSAVSSLHEAAIEDTDRIASEICKEIDSGISEHNRIVREIDEKYRNKNRKLAAVTAVTWLGALVPTLAPYLAVTPPALLAAPLVLGGKLAWDMLDRSAEKKKMSRSLMGVLAVARSGSD